MVLKFGDEKVFKIHIGPLNYLLDVSNPGKCRVCGQKPLKYIAYPCKHFYSCEDCYKTQEGNPCLFCKEKIKEHRNAF